MDAQHTFSVDAQNTSLLCRFKAHRLTGRRSSAWKCPTCRPLAEQAAASPIATTICVKPRDDGNIHASSTRHDQDRALYEIAFKHCCCPTIWVQRDCM